MITKKKQWMAAIGITLSAGLMKTWPILLDPDALDSLNLYVNYIAGKKTNISDLLGSVDVACAVGPYDSYHDARFSKTLTKKQIEAADNAIKSRNIITSGNNKIFLTGFRGDEVQFVYTSNFFSNSATLSQSPLNALHCIEGNGFITLEKLGSVISIKLEEGSK